MEEKFVPDFETPVSELSKDQMAEQYLRMRMEHLKNVEAEKVADQEAKNKAKEKAAMQEEISKYFGVK